jgi:4-hydroxybenzoate polyprenyltransferase
MARPDGRQPSLSPLIASVRPEQWTKNLLLFAGLMFGGRLLDAASAVKATAAFATLLRAVRSCVPVHDISDREATGFIR